jgi:sialidase-1
MLLLLTHLLFVFLISASADVPFTDIFTSHVNGHFCYRVPNVVRAPSGTILVFVEARGSSCDDQAPKDVMMSRSHDEGATWSSPEMVIPGFALGGSLTFRNPYPVFTANGTLVLQAANTTITPWFSLQLTSMDEGLTWSLPTPLTHFLGPFDGILNGPGSGLMLTQAPYTGRLLTCGTTAYKNFAGPNAAVVTYSTDEGVSWTISYVWTATDESKMAECQMAELRNGSVLANFRNQEAPRDPCLCRRMSRSDDGGATWTLPFNVPDLIEPVCSAGLQDTVAGLYFSNPASTKVRVNMTVRKSLDGGNTWPQSLQVYAGSAAYSTLVPVGDPASGGVGIVYERDSNPAIKISYARVSL